VLQWSNRVEEETINDLILKVQHSGLNELICEDDDFLSVFSLVGVKIFFCELIEDCASIERASKSNKVKCIFI
jgi:hypothetical protein